MCIGDVSPPVLKSSPDNGSYVTRLENALKDPPSASEERKRFPKTTPSFELVLITNTHTYHRAQKICKKVKFEGHYIAHYRLSASNKHIPKNSSIEAEERRRNLLLLYSFVFLNFFLIFGTLHFVAVYV